jgi:hypothetical protein
MRIPDIFYADPDPTFDSDTVLFRIRVLLCKVQKLIYILPVHHWYWCWRRICVLSEVVFVRSSKELVLEAKAIVIYYSHQRSILKTSDGHQWRHLLISTVWFFYSSILR